MEDTLNAHPYFIFQKREYLETKARLEGLLCQK